MKKLIKYSLLILASLCSAIFAMDAFATLQSSGIGAVAANATSSMNSIAKLITAGSYVAGLGFGVAAVVKFKAHKDNATQIPISTPIALLFVGAALMFIPSVFQTAGGTLFGTSGAAASPSGFTRISGFAK